MSTKTLQFACFCGETIIVPQRQRQVHTCACKSVHVVFSSITEAPLAGALLYRNTGVPTGYHVQKAGDTGGVFCWVSSKFSNTAGFCCPHCKNVSLAEWNSGLTYECQCGKVSFLYESPRRHVEKVMPIIWQLNALHSNTTSTWGISPNGSGQFVWVNMK